MDDSTTILNNILNEITVLSGQNGLLNKSDKMLDLLKDIKTTIEKTNKSSSSSSSGSSSTSNKKLEDEEKRHLEALQKERDDAFDKENNSRTRAALDLISSLKMGSMGILSFSKSIVSGGGDIHHAIGMVEDALGKIPVVGGAIGVAFGLIAKGAFDTVKTYKDLTASGVNFTGSLLELRTSAAKSGLSLDEFAGLLKANASTINQFGTQNFAELAKTVRETNTDLYHYGLGTKEISEYLADYLDTQRQAGILGKLNQNDLNTGFAETQKTLSSFSLATGKSMKELNESFKNTGKNVILNGSISGKSAEEQDKLRVRYAAITAVVPQLSGALESISAGFGGLTDDTFKDLMTYGGGLADVFREGQENGEDSNETMKKASKVAEELYRTQGQSLAQQAAAGNAAAKNTLEIIQSTRAFKEMTPEQIEQARVNKEVNNKLLEFQGTWAKLIMNIKLGFLNGLEPFFKAFTDEKFLDNLAQFAQGLGTAVGWIAEFIAKIVDLSTNVLGVKGTAIAALVGAFALLTLGINKIIFGPFKLLGMAISAAARGIGSLGKPGISAFGEQFAGNTGKMGKLGRFAGKFGKLGRFAGALGGGAAELLLGGGGSLLEGGLDVVGKGAGLLGKGAGAAAGGIGALGKLAGPGLRAAGLLAKGAAKAIPFVGVAVTIGEALYGAYEGYQKADELLDKKKEDLDFGDKLAAAGGGAIGALAGIADNITGLLGFETSIGPTVAKASAKALDMVKDAYVGAYKWIGGTISDLASGAMSTVSSAASSVWTSIFGSKTPAPTPPTNVATATTPTITPTVNTQTQQITAGTLGAAAGTLNTAAAGTTSDTSGTTSTTSVSDLLVALNSKLDSSIMKFNMLIDAVNKQTELFYPVLSEINKNSGDSVSAIKSTGGFVQ